MGENIAKRFLMKQAFTFIDRNYYSQDGEIDLIMKKDNTFHFIEVKTRIVSCENVSRETYMLEEAFTDKKYTHMISAIHAFMNEHYGATKMYINEWQIDYIIVMLHMKRKKYTIRWYRNYF